MLMIYSNRLSPRLAYTLHVAFSCVVKAEYHLTDQESEFSEHHGPRLNYSEKQFESVPNIIPESILFEDQITPLDCKFSMKDELPVLFRNDGSPMGYDALASIFFMVSRYEEYLDFEADDFGRFSGRISTAHQNGFLEKAVAHHWVKDLIAFIQTAYPEFKVEQNVFRIQPTIDIDNAYAYKNKSLIRTVGALVKSLTSEEKDFSARLRVLFGMETDPYDTYSYLKEVAEQHGCSFIFFMLTASYRKPDNNISPDSPAFKKLVKDLKQIGEIGIHPSLSSNTDNGLLIKEIAQLSEMVGSPVGKSRQHFLKLKFPETYRGLIEQKITDDYSMGFHDLPGFRAGIAVAYPFYDLNKEEQNEFMIHPSVFMESTFQYHLDLDLSEVEKRMENLMDEVRNVNGTFIPIWHNESLSNKGIWKGWRTIFEKMFELADHSWESS